MINKVIIVGHVGRDPEIINLDDNTKAKIIVATSKVIKRKNGEKEKITEWHTVVAWRKLAEIIKQYVKKGYMIYADGELRYDKYEKDDTTIKYSYILADNIRIINNYNSNKNNQSINNNQVVNNNQTNSKIREEFDVSDFYDDDDVNI